MFVKLLIPRGRRFVKRRTAWLGLGVCLSFAALVALLYQRVDARARVDGARRADAIIVLGSAVWVGEQPSPALRARTMHALELYRAGYAAHLIVCGGVGKYPPSEAEVMRRLALNAGVPAEALVLEDRSRSTEENLANAKALMEARGWRTAIIVSDSFHLYRAEIMARDLGMDVAGSGASNSPLDTIWYNHVYYTTREAMALIWYYATRVTGEPTWLYDVLKGKI